MNKRKGFTLLEVIIVLGIFSIVSVISLDAYFSSFQSQQRSNLQNKAIQDARFILGTIIEEVSNSQIDYEEYFNQCVILGSCPIESILEDVEDLDEKFYGVNHGYYSWQFFNSGVQSETDLTRRDGFGSLCQGAGTTIYRIPNDGCLSSSLSFSEDSNTGVNPNTPSLDITEVDNRKDDASSICSDFSINGFGTILGDNIITFPSQLDCSLISSNLFNELYLLNESGNKVILGKKLIGDSNYALAKIELEPVEIEIIDSEYPITGYQCLAKYICTKTISNITTTDEISAIETELKTADRSNLYTDTESNIYSNFVPISPLSVNVKNLQFFINPIEDPYKAYRETGLTHPTVTIILELEPSTKFKLPFFSPNFNLKLQTSVATAIPNIE